MERLFLSVLHMGMSASYLILAVMLTRLLLKKAPKSMICILWMVVGLRLLCPFQIETAFSLVPKQADSLASEILTSGVYGKASAVPENERPEISSVPEAADIQWEGIKIPPAENTDIISKIVHAAAWIWAAGMILMLLYLLFGWHRVQKHVMTAVPAEAEGIRFYQCDCIMAPFLFGLAAPKIYVPFSVSGQELSYVLKHEQAHKSRYDHLTKTAAYLLLAVYWFQPLVWAAYLLLCRDIELACDERVVREIGEDCKKAYSQVLLSCSSERRAAVCPVAFGEIGVKKRVKNILNYKKPGRRAVFAAAAVCVSVTVCFATEAESRRIPQTEPKTGSEAVQAVYPAAESENMPASSRKNLTAVTKCVAKWAEAFCGRDAKNIYGMLDDAGRKQLSDAGMLDGEHSFGWSSPWPWDAGVIDDQQNYRIMSVDGNSARILYYAWTSDPHVTVWNQVITYQYAEETGEIVIHETALEVLDEIHNAEQFFTAYPNGELDGTRMDYAYGNGAGEALSQNAVLRDNAKILYQPDTAAVFLLNIQDDSAAVKTDVTKRDEETIVTFTFLEDGSTASVKMIQQYGKYGIWIPQTDTENMVNIIF